MNTTDMMIAMKNKNKIALLAAFHQRELKKNDREKYEAARSEELDEFDDAVSAAREFIKSSNNQQKKKEISIAAAYFLGAIAGGKTLEEAIRENPWGFAELISSTPRG